MDSNSLAFLFLDEAMDDNLDMVALTGVLVHHRSYRDVRDAMCKLSWDIGEPPPNTFLYPPELHGSNLLPELNSLPTEEAEKKRLDVFRRCVEIINEHELSIFRSCYLNRSEIASVFKHDSKLYSLTFQGILAGLHTIMETTLIVPVMDGIPSKPSSGKSAHINHMLIQAFAENARSLHHARQFETVKDSLTVTNAKNLAEPVFADSSYSVMVQLADLVSYLLLQRDRAELGAQQTASQYKLDLLEEAKKIQQNLVFDSRGPMTIHKQSVTAQNPRNEDR